VVGSTPTSKCSVCVAVVVRVGLSLGGVGLPGVVISRVGFFSVVGLGRVGLSVARLGFPEVSSVCAWIC